MEIAINTYHGYGGFFLSEEAYDYLGLEWDNCGDKYADYNMRSNVELIQCIKALGEEINGDNSIIKIIEIPDNIEYDIYEHEDGSESIHEKHRIWS